MRTIGLFWAAVSSDSGNYTLRKSSVGVYRLKGHIPSYMARVLSLLGPCSIVASEDVGSIMSETLNTICGCAAH